MPPPATTFAGLFSAYTVTHKPASVISPPNPPTFAGKRDPGGVGFLDEVGGTVDGLMSCTESLGFESSDERSVDDQIEDLDTRHDHLEPSSFSRRSTNCLKRSFEKKEKKKFPPPLSSLNQDGKPNFFLRSVRKEGRLELTEVKIDRTETLFASRQDGRLRLHLIRDLEEIEEEAVEDLEDEIEEEEEEVIETIEENDDEKLDEGGEEDNEKVAEWKFPVTSGGGGGGVGGDSYRRCHGGHGHHELHVWRQHCVTTG